MERNLTNEQRFIAAHRQHWSGLCKVAMLINGRIEFCRLPDGHIHEDAHEANA